jgi:hypothetical protein
LIVPMFVLVAFAATALTVGRVVDPVPAFLGAILASVVIAVVGAVVGGGASGLRPSGPSLRGLAGLLVRLAAVGTVLVLASWWSDFATP